MMTVQIQSIRLLSGGASGSRSGPTTMARARIGATTASASARAMLVLSAKRSSLQRRSAECLACSSTCSDSQQRARRPRICTHTHHRGPRSKVPRSILTWLASRASVVAVGERIPRHRRLCALESRSWVAMTAGTRGHRFPLSDLGQEANSESCSLNRMIRRPATSSSSRRLHPRTDHLLARMLTGCQPERACSHHKSRQHQQLEGAPRHSRLNFAADRVAECMHTASHSYVDEKGSQRRMRSGDAHTAGCAL